MTWIQTLDNKAFDLCTPDPKVISPEVLSITLSRIPRFMGHTTLFYSVAQHSAIVCQMVVDSMPEDLPLQLAALLHDAHEAYWGFGDVSTPALESLPEPMRVVFKNRKSEVDGAVAGRFQFAPTLFNHPIVKTSDLIALATEKRDLMGKSPRPWRDLPAPHPDTITPMKSEKAAKLFLNLLSDITAAMEKSNDRPAFAIS